MCVRQMSRCHLRDLKIPGKSSGCLIGQARQMQVDVYEASFQIQIGIIAIVKP